MIFISRLKESETLKRGKKSLEPFSFTNMTKYDTKSKVTVIILSQCSWVSNKNSVNIIIGECTPQIIVFQI